VRLIFVIVLPLLELLGEQLGVVDDLGLQQKVKLLKSRSGGSVPPCRRAAGLDVAVPDALV
jgi:hypothetical protein